MRQPTNISPSSLATFEKNKESFYLTYLCETKIEKEPQLPAAAAGSAFDAYVKAKLQKDLFNKDDVFDKLFEAQVEKQNRDFAIEAGKHILENYEYCGAYIDLLYLMEGAQEDPKFEFEAYSTICDIPISGKPDCRFIHKNGAHIILDWKVNGYCSKNPVSPNKGYALCRDGEGWLKPSRSNHKSHGLYKPKEFMGLTINEFNMEHVSIDWADQLSMYGWMMGEEVGSEKMVVCIEQIASKPSRPPIGPPLLRIANHKSQVSKEYQFSLRQRLITMWNAIKSGYIFTELSEQENNKKCEELNSTVFSMLSDGTAEGDFFAACARPAKFYTAR